MARWTEEDIRTFWEMKREGASLIDIADRLGREYRSVVNLQYRETHKGGIGKMSNARMYGDNVPVATEQSAIIEPETEKGEPVKSQGAPDIDIAIRQAVAMIRGQGMSFDCVQMSLNKGYATMELYFKAEESENGI